jgi:glycerophosphoryl diester phosphodiesterase
VRVLRGDGPPIRIGHRGAAALAPENTLDALRAGIAERCEYVEFDVLSDARGELVLAHSRHEVPETRATFDEALELLEARIAGALRSHGLLDRSLVSSLDWSALRDLRRHEPKLRVGLSYPEDRYGLAGRRAFTPLLSAGLATMKRALPRLVGRWLDRASASAAVVHRQLVTPALIRTCHARSTALWAWTVNDSAEAARLIEWGADAIITDDPRTVGL